MNLCSTIKLWENRVEDLTGKNNNVGITTERGWNNNASLFPEFSVTAVTSFKEVSGVSGEIEN